MQLDSSKGNDHEAGRREKAQGALSVSAATVNETLRSSPVSSVGQTPSTEASLAWSLVCAALLTVLFYSAIWPFSSSTFGGVFFNANPAIAWVPPALILLAAWAISMLVLKRRRFRAQAMSMKLEILPPNPTDISPRNVEPFVMHIRNLSENWRESFVLNRVARALAHFRSRQSRTEVASLLASQADIDMSRVVSSYTMLRTLIWALPILGFIGTVLGIGTAVDGFSGLSDLNQLESSLAVVTGGLAGAFETTLIALVLSMLIMLPTAASQKNEQALLDQIDEYCNDALLRRLRERDNGEQERDWNWDSVGKIIARGLRDNVAEIGPMIGSQIGTEFSGLMRREMLATAATIAESFKPLVLAAGTLEKSTNELATAIDKVSSDLSTALERASELPDNLRNEMLPVINELRSVSSELAANRQSQNEASTRIAQEIGVATNQVKELSGQVSSSAEGVLKGFHASNKELVAATAAMKVIVSELHRVSAGLEFRGKSTQVRAALTELSGAVQRMVSVSEELDQESEKS